ncbi:MAG TPA: hypothetical protein VH374_21520 [Polyangia bacterium]|jgi:uncharacterized repeat protein (TIGR01451 family)|nr:hypothetical protein [Polyangia bacterium]
MSRSLVRSLLSVVALSALVGCTGSAPAKPDGGGGKGGGGIDGTDGGATGGGSGSTGTGGTTDSPDGAAGVDGSSGGTPGTDGAAAGADGSAAGSDGGMAGTDGGAAGAGDGAAGTGGMAGGFQMPATALMFDVSTNVDPVAPGGRVRYTIKIGNVSPQAVDGVSVSLLLPTGLQFNYANDSEPNTGCGAFTCGANNQATWTIGTLAAGQSATILVNATVLQTVADGSSIATSFKLAATNFNTVSFNKTVQVRAQSSSQLATGTATYPLTPGQRFTLDLDLGQLGMVPLANTTLEATLAPGLTVASISDGGTQATAGGPIDWAIGSVGVGAALHRQVDVTVDPNVPAGALLNARATLAYDGGLAIDAAAEYTLAVVSAAPPLAISVTATPNPAVPGARLQYRLTITNLGTRAIDDIAVFNPVAPGLSFNYANDSQPNTGCGSTTCTGDLESNWAIGTLAAGASTAVDVSATVVASIVGNGNLVRSSFVVSATGVAQLETVKTVQIFDSPAAQLALTATANPITNAQAFTYNLDIGQIGAAPLATTQLRAHLPAGLTVGTISDGGAKDAASGDIVWAIGGVAVGATLHRTVAVTGDGSAAPGTIIKASASLTYDGGAAVDNLVGYDIAVLAAAQPMTMTVAAGTDPAIPGMRDLYSATITNTSGRAIDGVGLFLRVPAGLQFNYANDADPDAGCGNFTCVQGNEAVWTIGSMAAGAVQMVTINQEVLNTLLAGSLIPSPFWLSYTGQTAPIFVDLVVPTHP